MFPLDKYKFTVNGNVVTATSTYAGKPVTGVAKCDPADTFDLDVGKRLAAARCGAKIATKRYKNAHKKYYEAKRASDEAEKRVLEMREYYYDSEDAMYDADYALFAIREQLGDLPYQKEDELPF